MRERGGGRFNVHSAGSHPSGKVNPKALAALARKNYPTEGLRSKSWDEFSGAAAPALDYVFTVCGNAKGETCPIWIGAPVQAHWGIADPSGGESVGYDQALGFIEARVEAFLKLPLDTFDHSQIKAALNAIGTMEGAA